MARPLLLCMEEWIGVVENAPEATLSVESCRAASWCGAIPRRSGMADMATTAHKARVREQFGASAAAYVASPGHATGADLAQLVAWVEGGPNRVALDVATGG